MTLTRFGFHFSSMTYPGVGSNGLFARIVEVARAAESSGFDSIWVPDHVHQNPIGGGPSGPMPEAYTLLAGIAARTETAMLGACVTPVTFRHPALLAKAVTTLDVVSGGRAILGLGAAWDTGEHAAYDIAFPPVGEREDRLEEAVLICRALFAGEPASFDGRFATLADAWNAPQPVQARIPVLVGGGGERRTLAIVARHADACNLFGEPEVLAHKIEVLDEHCERAGRDRAEIAVTCALMAPESTDELIDQVGQRLAAGADGALVFAGSAPGADTVAEWGTALRGAFA